MFKRYLKSEHKHRQTDTHRHTWTDRLIESIGPEGRCFENGMGSAILTNMTSFQRISIERHHRPVGGGRGPGHLEKISNIQDTGYRMAF